MYLFVFSALFLSGCEKNLDLKPLDALSEATYFKTEKDFETFANQFYLTLPDLGSGDDNADLSMATNRSAISNGSYAPAETSSIWDNNYRSIWQSSYLIEKAGEAPADIKTAIARYTAEARFFRAFAHFDLLKNFGGVPIVDKRLGISSDDILYGPRNTRAEVAAFILAELDKAIPDLPASGPGTDNGRLSKWAALALKARVALFEGTWRKFHENGNNSAEMLDQAISASTEILNSNLFELFDRRDVLGDSSYRYYFLLEGTRKTNAAGLTKAAQRETILARRHDRDISPSPALNIGQGVLSPTRKLVDMFLSKDGLPIEKSPLFEGYAEILSEYRNRDPRMKNWLITPFQKYWLFTQPAYHKNWDNPGAGGIIYDIAFGILTQTGYSTFKMQQEIGGPHGNDYPVFRLAEIYLILAEALFEKNGAITDVQLDQSINKLRTRVGMPSLNNAFVATNGLDMREEIRRERSIELYVENFRFDDLRRWKTAETEMPKAVRGIKWKGTEFEQRLPWSNLVFQLDADGFIVLEAASQRQFLPRHYLRPLPIRQILLNPSLEQNPGW
ncbi:MAG: hypothetical protein A1D16_09335 [Flavihumibacter sp. CACIAM 22H1]|nr:MAG: hypothetical protein A1D16_09335 [Flavihumibacter sp. CACIAM 22H1]